MEKVAGLHPGRNDSEGRWSVMYQKSKEKKFNNYYLFVLDIREKLMITIATADIKLIESRTRVRRLAVWNDMCGMVGYACRCSSPFFDQTTTLIT